MNQYPVVFPSLKEVFGEDFEAVFANFRISISDLCKILSGCLYTVKNSTYTGVNNIVTYTVLSPLYASSIGFTDENIRKLLEDAGLADLHDTVEKWYDGYIFGRDRMYCP